MAMMVDEKEDVLAGLRRRIEECEAESRRLKQLAEDKEREARGLRVKAAREQHQREITPPPPPLPVRIRNYAMGVDTFSEDELAAELGVPKAKLHRQLAEFVDDGLLACSRRGRSAIYALLAPEPDRAARPRHETPENLVAFEERRRGTVAGSGRSKLSGRKDVDRLARAAKKGGATVTKQGNGHIKMVKDGEKVTMSATPRASGMSKTKKDLSDLGIAV